MRSPGWGIAMGVTVPGDRVSPPYVPAVLFDMPSSDFPVRPIRPFQPLSQAASRQIMDHASSSRLEVFLSHATSDQTQVALVRQQIEALGISVYLAEHDPKPGTVLAEKVREAIRRSHAVVVLITTSSINSAYVQQEVGIAHECGKPLVPIIEKGIDTRQLGILQGLEYLELDPAHPAETMAKMTASLQPIVVSQLAAINLSVSMTQVSMPDLPTSLVLIGLGAIIALLVVAAISSEEPE